MVSSVSWSGGTSETWMHCAGSVLYTSLILMHLNFKHDLGKKPGALYMQSLRLGRCIDSNIETYD